MHREHSNLVAGSILLLCLLALAAGAWFFLGTSPPPRPAAVPNSGPPVAAAPEEQTELPEGAPTEVKVVAIRGKAEVKRARAKRWLPLATGDSLRTEDAVRSGPKSSVTLVAARHRLELSAGTDVSVKALTDGLSAFLVGRGMIQAQSSGERVLKVEAVGSDVQVTASEAQFEFSSNGKGTVAVASQRGEVSVAARGESVVLKGGTQTLIRPKGAPAPPRPISPKLLLRVRWPSAHRTRDKVVRAHGHTQPGAQIYADGVSVPVDAHGDFVLRRSLREGGNKIVVHGRAVGGVIGDTKSPSIVLDTKGAKADFNTKNLWK